MRLQKGMTPGWFTWIALYSIFRKAVGCVATIGLLIVCGWVVLWGIGILSEYDPTLLRGLAMLVGIMVLASLAGWGLRR